MPTAYIYARVSTDEQDVKNQMLGVNDYLTLRAMKDRRIFTDNASGKTDWRARALGNMLAEMKNGDWLVVSEISRLARSTLGVLEIMAAFAAKDIQIHAVKSGIVLDGSMQAKVIATVFGLAAEIEREFISTRTAEALARRRALGLPMGRPPGEAKTLKLDQIEKQILQWKAKGLGMASIAKLADCAPSTLYQWAQRRYPTWIKREAGDNQPLTSP